MSVRILPIAPDDLEIVWPKVKKYLQSAIDKTSDRYSVEDIRFLILDNKAQLWTVLDESIIAAFVTTIEHSGSSFWVRIMWAGGERVDDWLPVFEQVEQWARSIGASKMVIYGRSGWKKKLPTYRQAAVVLEKELQEITNGE